MNHEDEIRPMMGGEESKWSGLADESGKQLGITDPEGNHYSFRNGERYIFVGEPGKGKPFIVEKDGEQIPFQEWKDKQSN